MSHDTSDTRGPWGPWFIDTLTQLRSRLQQLQTVAAELAPVTEVAHVIETVRLVCVPRLTAAGGHLALVSWERGIFETVEPLGEAPSPVDLRPGAPVDPAHPWTRAIASGQPDFGSQEPGGDALLPLPSRERAYGLLSLKFSHPPDDDEQSFLLSLTGLIGQALDRTIVQERLAHTRTQLEAQHQEAQTLNAELRGYTLALTRNVGEPIRRIRDFLRVVEQRLEPTLDARTRQLFTFARLEADQLGDRVAELRTLAMIDSRELKFEQVNLNRLLVQVQHDLEPLTLGRKVQWQIGTLPTVEADALLLWQVLVELLGFMLEDVLDQPSPVIGIEGEQVDGHLLLRFWDQGRGFDQVAAERMFDVLDRSVPRTSGLARLGLSNVRRVVNRHGGRIWAEGRPGEGARFFVSLPRRHDPPDPG